MKRIVLKTFSVAAGILLLGVSAAGLYVVRTWNRIWDTPKPALHASRDPAVIARGEYLALGPAHCAECHVAAAGDLDKALETGTQPVLAGGMKFAAPPLGVIYSANITPDLETGIGRYTDPELARMLRYSVRPDGHASVQLLMPYGNMSDADVVAIISYLRTQPAIAHRVPDRQWTVIGKIVKSFAPVFKPRETIAPAAAAPDVRPTRERGEYLARNVANCVACHTERDSVSFAPVKPEFAGGNEMEPGDREGTDKAVWFRTPNLTPARDSALSKFPDRATFIARFQRGGRQYAGSPMPWECFARMNEQDLGALYEFLHSLAPQHGPTGDPRFKKAG
jgi:mono/diheme cytochrome c family protein